MKRIPIALAALATFMQVAYAQETAGPSKPSFSGDFAVYGGRFWINDYAFPLFSDHGTVIGGAGRINYWFLPTVSGQFDFDAEYVRDTVFPAHTAPTQTTFNFAAHLNRRSGNILFGGFASVGVDRDWWESTFGTIGVEGQVNLSNHVVLYTQAGGFRSLSGTWGVSGAFVRGEGRYFIDPNTMAAANLGYSLYYYFNGADAVDAIQWGVDLEHRFTNSPFSVFASYQGSHEQEPAEAESWAVHSLLVGLKLSFGTQTLEEASKTGPTLRDYNPMTGANHIRFSDWE